MIRLLFILPLLMLAACKSQPVTPCMSANETGTVISAKSATGEHCYRTGCQQWENARVVLRMANGTDRLCVIDDISADLLTIGQKLSIPNARRLY